MFAGLTMCWAQPAGAADRADPDLPGFELAQADEAREFSIPPQLLASALDSFADQTGLSFAYRTSDISALRSPGASGRLAPREALQRLLAGTGMTFAFTGASTVTLMKATTESGEIVLDPLRVEATAQPESAYGPVDGYKASRSATATKTDTPIMETPASVQVVPRQVIEDQGALNLKDVYENVSGVQQAGNTLNAQTEVLPIIRGFESPTLLRNGLRSTRVGAVDLVNVERVEVLKGPASILYGALEPGGIVNYVTKRPEVEASHRVEQQFGSFELFRTTVDSTGALNEDGSLAYRLNAAYTNSDSFRDYIELERAAVAPSILWQPTDQTELLLDFSYLHEEQPYDGGIPLSADGDPLVDEDTFFNDPDLAGRTIDDYTASYQLTHEFNSVWRIRNQFQWHRAEADNEALRPAGVADLPGFSALGFRYQNEERQDDEAQFVLDVTAEFETGPLDHTLLFGSELIAQESDFRRFRAAGPIIIISDDPSIDFDPPEDQPKEVILAETQWAGIYLQDQISLLEDGRLHLLLGGRYDIVHQVSETDGVDAPNVNDEAFSGRAGLLYEFSDQYSAYASISESFSPQTPGTLDANGTPLDPEEGLQYEVGVKASFLDERLLATASLFQIEKENVAVFDQDLFNNTGQTAFFPGIEQRSRGFEFDLSGALTDQIRIIANYSYTDTKVLKNPGDPTMVGEPFGGVPAHKARVWMAYGFDENGPLSGFGLGGGIRYVGESTPQFDTGVILDDYVVVDAAAWYSWETVRASLNVYNLLDEDYIARASDRAIAHPGQPLTFVGAVSVRF